MRMNLPTRFAVAGSQFCPIAAQVRLSELREGERVILKPEPTNAYDPNAIQIITEDDVFIGYVPARIAKHLVSMLDQVSASWDFMDVVVSPHAEPRG